MDKLFSFVLPAYKSRYLKIAIDSILSQTYTNFELIIVNDASPEDIDSVVGAYNDTRIRYYKNAANLGGINLVQHWNSCLTYASGDYVILASDDDEYDLRFLSVMNELIQNYPTVNVFRPRVCYINGIGDRIGVEGYIKEHVTMIEFIHAWSHGWIGSGIPFYVFNRHALMAIGGFVDYPLAWFSDDATVIKMASSGVVSSSEILFSFRMSGISITTKKNSIESLKMKIAATKVFYADIQKILNDYEVTAEDSFILEQIRNLFPRYIEKNKLYGQLFHTSFLTLLRLLPEVARMDFVSSKTLTKYFLIYLYKKIK